MPLPKQEINWVARLVVLLISAGLIALWLPVAVLLARIGAPDWLAAGALVFHIVLALFATLWAITVWFPKRGAKIAEFVLNNLRYF